jgi:hypothetical protein
MTSTNKLLISVGSVAILALLVTSGIKWFEGRNIDMERKYEKELERRVEAETIIRVAEMEKTMRSTIETELRISLMQEWASDYTCTVTTTPDGTRTEVTTRRDTGRSTSDTQTNTNENRTETETRRDVEVIEREVIVEREKSVDHTITYKKNYALGLGLNLKPIDYMGIFTPGPARHKWDVSMDLDYRLLGDIWVTSSTTFSVSDIKFTGVYIGLKIQF